MSVAARMGETPEEPHENDQATKSGEMLGRSEFETWNLLAAGVNGAPGNLH